MIRDSAKKRILSQERDSWSWLKKLPEHEIDKMISKLKRPLVYASADRPLFKHQKIGVLLGLWFRGFAFWYDMGSGKSRLSLVLIERFWQAWEIRGRRERWRALIMAKNDNAAHEWVAQIKEWGVSIPYVVLGDSSSAEKWEALDAFEDGIVIATYGGIVPLLTRARTDAEKKKLKKRGTKKTTPDKDAIARFSNGIQICFFDESTRAANKTSLTFRILEQIARLAKRRYALAGRPFGRDPEQIFAQMLLADGGASLGDTLGLFRSVFFEAKPGYWGGWTYRLTKQGEKHLARAIEHRSLSYSPEECGFKVPCIKHHPGTDLPALKMPDINRAYLDAVLKDLRKARGDKRAIGNAFLRMRQISSGYIGIDGDEDGSKVKLELPANPKLDWMLDHLDQLPLDCKWIVFHHFIFPGQRLHEEVDRLGINHVWVTGQTKNNIKSLERFKTDPKVRGLIANSVAWYSLNAQVANYVFFYESPVDPKDREQAERRAWRTGQTKIVHMYDPCVAGTADETILAFHKEGDNLMRALVRDPDGTLNKVVAKGGARA